MRRYWEHLKEQWYYDAHPCLYVYTNAGTGDVIGDTQSEALLGLILLQLLEPVSYTHLDVYKRQGQ